jgi:hypothetical protein
MKNKNRLISLLYFILYISFSFPFIGLLLWFLIEKKVIKSNFEGSLLVPISLGLTLLVFFILSRVNSEWFVKNNQIYL